MTDRTPMEARIEAVFLCMVSGHDWAVENWRLHDPGSRNDNWRYCQRCRAHPSTPMTGGNWADDHLIWLRRVTIALWFGFFAVLALSAAAIRAGGA